MCFSFVNHDFECVYVIFYILCVFCHSFVSLTFIVQYYLLFMFYTTKKN